MDVPKPPRMYEVLEKYRQAATRPIQNEVIAFEQLLPDEQTELMFRRLMNVEISVASLLSDIVDLRNEIIEHLNDHARRSNRKGRS